MDTFDHLWKEAEVTRRELVAAGAAPGFVAGFALSAQPVQAQSMIVTDTAGIDAAMGEFPTPTRTGPRLSHPAGRRHQAPADPGGAGNFRRARAHQGRLPPARQAMKLRSGISIVGAISAFNVSREIN